MLHINEQKKKKIQTMRGKQRDPGPTGSSKMVLFLSPAAQTVQKAKPEGIRRWKHSSSRRWGQAEAKTQAIFGPGFELWDPNTQVHLSNDSLQAPLQGSRRGEDGSALGV